MNLKSTRKTRKTKKVITTLNKCAINQSDNKKKRKECDLSLERIYEE